jgi:hypothetical protein
MDAIRDELGAFRSALQDVKAELGALRVAFNELRVELRGELAALRAELHGEVAGYPCSRNPLVARSTSFFGPRIATPARSGLSTLSALNTARLAASCPVSNIART